MIGLPDFVVGYGSGTRLSNDLRLLVLSYNIDRISEDTLMLFLDATLYNCSASSFGTLNTITTILLLSLLLMLYEAVLFLIRGFFLRPSAMNRALRRLYKSPMWRLYHEA